MENQVTLIGFVSEEIKFSQSNKSFSFFFKTIQKFKNKTFETEHKIVVRNDINKQKDKIIVGNHLAILGHLKTKRQENNIIAEVETTDIMLLETFCNSNSW